MNQTAQSNITALSERMASIKSMLSDNAEQDLILIKKEKKELEAMKNALK